ncbi:unnamed protein product [Acanthoscelides obtectus]|uniref:Uncharacterized protein n=1 Tax=Acanthoscelides obtectus TaxID=200917 RepID=A0A9P0LAC0_ACAOB|nr:unnamed protein product [Acanthoscelides obtectus]CAK1633045.1 hypothetical protein AOBTE_LOCUS7901 [Acanthoscelides obtectus]
MILPGWTIFTIFVKDDTQKSERLPAIKKQKILTIRSDVRLQLHGKTPESLTHEFTTHKQLLPQSCI